MDKNFHSNQLMLPISIVVPVFNEQDIFHQQQGMFEALQADAEVIFCDGGSTDGTWESLEKSTFHHVKSATGRAKQMNAGAQQAQGHILLFVHIDTLLNTSHLQAVHDVMADMKVLGGRFDVRLSGQKPIFRIIEQLINIRSRWTKVSTGDQCQFVRQDIFESMGGFPDLALMEDVAFSKQLKRLGKIVCLRQTVETSSRRWEKHGTFKTIGLMWKLRFLYWLGVPAEQLAKMYR